MPSTMLRTTRPTSRNSSGVCSMGGWINMPKDIAFCTLSSRFRFRAELFCFACCPLKWRQRLSLWSNVLLQQSTGQGYLPSMDRLTVIRPVAVRITQVDYYTNRRCPPRWWRVAKQMLHSWHWKFAMNIGWQYIDVWEGIRIIIDNERSIYQ
jgi:hypothetical protein